MTERRVLIVFGGWIGVSLGVKGELGVGMLWSDTSWSGWCWTVGVWMGEAWIGEVWTGVVPPVSLTAVSELGSLLRGVEPYFCAAYWLTTGE